MAADEITIPVSSATVVVHHHHHYGDTLLPEPPAPTSTSTEPTPTASSSGSKPSEAVATFLLALWLLASFGGLIVASLSLGNYGRTGSINRDEFLATASLAIASPVLFAMFAWALPERNLIKKMQDTEKKEKKDLAPPPQYTG